MSDAEAATLRDFADWLTNRSPEFYVCTSGPGYDYPDYIPLRDDAIVVARLLAAYAAYRATPPEPPAFAFGESMMGRAMTAASVD